MSDFPAKWAKKLPENFIEETESKSTDQLKNDIVRYEQAQSDSEKDMENDPKLEEARKEVKELADVYKVAITELKAKVKYIAHVLKDRGVG